MIYLYLIYTVSEYYMQCCFTVDYFIKSLYLKATVRPEKRCLFHLYRCSIFFREREMLSGLILTALLLLFPTGKAKLINDILCCVL